MKFFKTIYDVVKYNGLWVAYSNLPIEDVISRLRQFLRNIPKKKHRHYLKFWADLKDPDIILSYLREAGDLITM